MTRSNPYLLLLALLGALALPACPSGGNGDDDDDDATDDDDDDDDDGATDPCDSVSDISANLDGTPVTGATLNSSDTMAGSCTDGIGGSETVYAITPDQDGLISASTDSGLTDFDTVLYVLSECGNTGTELACNDDIDAQGGNYSSYLEWDATAGTTYYLVVDGYDSAGGFELTIQLAICGDGTVSGDEQCDDGGTDGGDGCDADCNWECTDDANEDDDTIADATSTAGESFPATFEDLVLCPGDLNEELGVYLDIWEVTVAEGEYVSALTEGGASLTTECADQTLSVILLDEELVDYAAGSTVDGDCARFAAEPEPGTYYVAVFWNDQTVAPQDYDLTVDVGTAVCGNNELEGLEECDDGNTDGDDGCSATCVEEDATCTVVSAVESTIGGTNTTGDTSQGTDDHEPQACGLAGGAPEDVYSLTVTEDQTIIIDLDHEGTTYDTTAYVREACVDPGSEIACNDDGPGGLSSALFFEAAKDVTYYIFVDGYDADGGAYEMSLSVPVCGDGNVDLNEDCDDQNTDPLDGCANDCTFTPVCAYPADTDWGALTSGDNVFTVDLSSATDTYPDLSCSEIGDGENLLVSFSIPTAGDIDVSFEQTSDALFGLFSDGATCDEGICFDPVAAADGEFSLPGAAAGDYVLALEAYEAGSGGSVTFTVTVP